MRVSDCAGLRGSIHVQFVIGGSDTELGVNSRNEAVASATVSVIGLSLGSAMPGAGLWR